LRKTPYALRRSCRGSADLQLSYSNLGALQFNLLEKTAVEQGYVKNIWHWERESACSTSPAPRQFTAAPPYTRAETGRWPLVCGLHPNLCAWRRATHGRCHTAFPHPPDGAPPYAIGRRSPARRRSPRRTLPYARRHAAPILRCAVMNDLRTAFTRVKRL
jgi:hypothetical protein